MKGKRPDVAPPFRESIEILVKDSAFNNISSGRKTFELRVDQPDFAGVAVGTKIIFKLGELKEIEVQVVDIRRYASFKDALDGSDITALYPGMSVEEINGLSSTTFAGPKMVGRQLVRFEFKKIE